MSPPLQPVPSAEPQGPAAELAQVLDEIARRFGSVMDELSTDPHVRRLLANQLALRGARVGPPPIEATPETTTGELGLAEIVGGLQLQVDALWREVQRVQGKLGWFLQPVVRPPEPPRNRCFHSPGYPRCGRGAP